MINKLKTVDAPFWILTIAVFIGLLLPKMIQEGMFMDGMLYACVSNNLANGFGTFWFPRFSQLGIANLTTFHEHPPLVFSFQALFFKIFGNSFYTEKIYSFFTACITAWLIVKSWKLIHNDKPEFVRLSWMPVLFWIIMPIVYFSFQNNLMENTMGIFILMAFYFALKALKFQKQIWFNLILSGIAIFLASFSKGVPGLFPIGIAGIWWLIKRNINFKQMVLYTLLLILVPAIIYFLLVMLNDNAMESLTNYTVKRLFHRIQSAHTVGNRFHVLEKLIVETGPSIILTIIFLFSGSFKALRKRINLHYRSDIIFVFCIGFAGTIPLMLTLVQKSFYFVQSLPFFALGLAMLSAPVVNLWIKKINKQKVLFKVFYVLSIVGLISITVYSVKQIGKTERDHAMLHDVHLIGKVIPEGTLIGIDGDMHNDWALHCYMVRYFNISFDPLNAERRPYILSKRAKLEANTNTFKKKDLPLKIYSLYQRKINNTEIIDIH